MDTNKQNDHVRHISKKLIKGYNMSLFSHTYTTHIHVYTHIYTHTYYLTSVRCYINRLTKSYLIPDVIFLY